MRDLQGKQESLKAAIQDGEAAKKAKKAQIKQWMTDFEQREGRQPTNQDKEAIKVGPYA
jgi:predicted transcriptional regulator